MQFAFESFLLLTHFQTIVFTQRNAYQLFARSARFRIVQNGPVHTGPVAPAHRGTCHRNAGRQPRTVRVAADDGGRKQPGGPVPEPLAGGVRIPAGARSDLVHVLCGLPGQQHSGR